MQINLVNERIKGYKTVANAEKHALKHINAANGNEELRWTVLPRVTADQVVGYVVVAFPTADQIQMAINLGFAGSNIISFRC